MVKAMESQDDKYIFFPEIEGREKVGRMAETTFINVARKAGMPEEFLYAFHKCGFLVTSYNKSQCTKKELGEWQKAIDEYREGKGKMPM